MTKKILMIVANPATSPVTGWPVGFWWAELSHAWLEFHSAGYDITIASPNGGDLSADNLSDPDDESGYSASDLISVGFKTSPITKDLIKDTPALSSLTISDYDALFVVGGQSPMVSMIDNTDLQTILANHYEKGKVTAAVCHGTCVLLKTKLSNGQLLVSGKKWTGFADSEEQYVEQTVGQKVQPFWIETEARKLPDTEFVTGGPMAEFAVKDGNLITGQQQVSSGAAARLVINALS